MRDTAKMVNFGIAYGMGEFGLASRTDLTREEAEAFIKSYYTNFPGIADWQEATLTVDARTRATAKPSSAAAATSRPSAAPTSRFAPLPSAKPSTCPSRAPPPTSSRSP